MKTVNTLAEFDQQQKRLREQTPDPLLNKAREEAMNYLNFPMLKGESKWSY